MKLRGFGLDVDRDGVERLCAGALSAQEVAEPILDKLNLGEIEVDWVWISLLALWQRWWPDRVCHELLDDKIQAGYDQDPENDTHAAAVIWLDAWSDVQRLCDAAGIGSIEEFDDRSRRRSGLGLGLDRLGRLLPAVGWHSGRPDGARQLGEQARRLRHEPLRPAARPAPSPGNTALTAKVGRNAPCPCGRGKKFKKCCGSPLNR